MSGWDGAREKRKEKFKSLKYVDSICGDTCNAQDHFKPTALTQKIG